MKYINADHLLSNIKETENEFKTGNYYLDNSEQAVGYYNALMDFEKLISSLQQEQPEVDLNAEIEKELRLHYNDDQDVYWWNYLKNSFRHFYELGLNARKEE